MGNCAQCLREGPQSHKSKGSMHSHTASTMFDEITNTPKYLKLTLPQVYQEGLEDLNYIQSINPESHIAFTIHIHNMRLMNFILKDEVFIQGDIDEDTSKRRKEIYKRNKAMETIQSTTTLQPSNISFTEETATRAKRFSMEFPETKGIRWRTNLLQVDTEGNLEIMMDNHFKYECKYKDIWSKCVIVEFYSTKNPHKPFSYLAVDFLALAIGPKQCDFEVRDYKTRRYVGRIAFDISIKQLMMMEVSLLDLKCKLNKKEEKALYSQFKLITNHEAPKLSETTYSQTGRYKKEKAYTKFRWMLDEDQDTIPTVRQVVSLESLKNSSLHLVVKVDRNFSEAMHRQVLEKITLAQKYQLLRGEKLFNKPQISIHTVDQAEGLNQSTRNPQLIEEDIEKIEKRDSKINMDASLLNPQEKKKLKVHKSFAAGFNQQTTKFQHSSYVNNQLEDRKLSKVDIDKIYGSNQQIATFLDEADDPMEMIKKIEIVKRSKSIIQKRERKTITIDASQYYSKYNEVGDSSQSLIKSLIGECHIGVTKLLQCEYRKLDRRDSNILTNKLNSSIKHSMSLDSTNLKDVIEKEKMSERDKDEVLSQGGRKHQKYKNDQKYFQEKLWDMGKVIGTISGYFKVINLPIIQQMALGILTENGIVMNTAPILIEDINGIVGGLKRKNRMNEKITQLIDLTKRLQKIDQYKTKRQIYQTYNEKEKILNEIINILCESDKTVQGHMYKYQDDFDLIRAQQALIELAFHCLLLVESVRYEFRRDYYEIISQVLMRDELKLPNVTLRGTNLQGRNGNLRNASEFQDNSFVQRLKESTLASPHPQRFAPTTRDVDNQKLPTLTQNNIQTQPDATSVLTGKTFGERYDEDTKEKLRNEKLKIAIFYQKLLYQTLEDCLYKFTRKDVEPYLKSYLEICISLSFFRVPRFQRLFVSCISQNLDMVIDEWKGMSWNLDDETDLNIEAGVASLYDWHSNFHSMIPDSMETYEAQQLMMKIEGNKRWQARIQKRSIAYFQIVRRWANLLNEALRGPNPFWQDVPGYAIILKSMLVQLKERNVADYADSLVDSIASLLHNPQLLTVFVNIIFAKTNAYDSRTLCYTMDIATKWINYIEQNNCDFPSNFDFQYFIKGIQVAIEMEHSLSTPRTLYLVYRIIHFLPFDQRSKIINMLLQPKLFYSLIFSWSYTIRDIFISLLLYQFEYFYICRFANSIQQNIESMNLDRGSTVATQFSDFEHQHTLSGKVKKVEISRLKAIKRESNRWLEHFQKCLENFNQENPNEGFGLLDSKKQFKTRHQYSETELASNQSQPQAQVFNSAVFLEKKPSIQEQQPKYLDSHLNCFMKTFQSFKIRMQELEIMDDYHSIKKAEKLKGTSRLDSTLNQSPTTLETEQQQSSEAKTQDIEQAYGKIVAGIPSQLRIYVGSLIDEFYKQMEEYEVWKSSQNVHYQCDILSALPEFNMEKSMPIEDDDILDKQEEW